VDNQELNQPQVEGTQDAQVSGAVQPQVAELPAVSPTPSGAEQEAAKPARTYTQKEWSEREAAKDKEIAEVRKFLAQQALAQEIAQAQAAEAQAQAADRRDVETGEITEADASQRPRQRFQAWQQEMARRQQQGAFERAQAETNEGLRFLSAHKMAEEHGVDVKELLADQTLTTPILMEAKALKLALEKAKAELKGRGETFDSGQVGNLGRNVEAMSAEEKIRYGLTQPTRKR